MYNVFFSLSLKNKYVKMFVLLSKIRNHVKVTLVFEDKIYYVHKYLKWVQSYSMF